ncbi:hypothetical protein EGR_10232 [Echinococcus granulosus]|uniref:Uncharacterized protein n=1 Tax=Echinococcus granulosus TaxID=6210 RepID=W6U8S7_ECHGR|nr:hypothetical protein EGR_10232 [Echinococcus granulosus]EUB54922.1 hypothetical protein EGR_10232 [Echinococcus granulosus]
MSKICCFLLRPDGRQQTGEMVLRVVEDLLKRTVWVQLKQNASSADNYATIFAVGGMMHKYTESVTFSSDLVLSPCLTSEPTFNAIARRYNVKCSGELFHRSRHSRSRNVRDSISSKEPRRRGVCCAWGHIVTERLVNPDAVMQQLHDLFLKKTGTPDVELTSLLIVSWVIGNPTCSKIYLPE